MNDAKPKPRGRRLLPALLLLAGCRGDDGLQRPDVLLTIDGLDIRFTEVEPHVKFLDSIGPEWATRVKFRRVLDEFTIPLRLAQRAFPAERAKMLERAQHLRSVATNVIELEQQGAQQVMKRQDVPRRGVEIPVAAFLFDPMTTGGVSDPIEVPRGWIVAGAFEIK